jgi:hypothetical protein
MLRKHLSTALLLVFPFLLLISGVILPLIRGRATNLAFFCRIQIADPTQVLLTVLLGGIVITGLTLLQKDSYLRLAGTLFLLLAFFFFSSRSLNPDGEELLWKLPQAFEEGTIHTVHDEMLELAVHSAAFNSLHQIAGLSVEQVYRVFSALSGVVFVLVLSAFARRHVPENPTLFSILVMSGGFVQLFFGDVENYSITNAVVMIYLLLGADALLRDRQRIAVRTHRS